MAQNRYLPYGYKIENGKTTVEPQEAETIRKIYSRYAQGMSYKKIAEQLTESGVRYMPDKPQWNKNMVARILQNQSYLGTEKYPAIIENVLSHAARQMEKPYTHTESADIKLLKPLLFCGICGAQVNRRLKTSGEERWYCHCDTKHIAVALTDETLLENIKEMQNHLATNRYHVEARQDSEKQIDIGIVRMQNQIDLALNQQGADLVEVQQSIMALAAQRHLAKLLSEQLPQIGGFSMRNLRRMRDFYCTYENQPELMQKAQTLGWTQNAVILDCCDTDAQRPFYMGLAAEKKLSKLVLMRAIATEAFEAATEETVAECDHCCTAVGTTTPEETVDTTTVTGTECGAFVTTCEPFYQGDALPTWVLFTIQKAPGLVRMAKVYLNQSNRRGRLLEPPPTGQPPPIAMLA